MIKIIKGAEPEDWKAFKKKNPRLNYRQLNDSEQGKEERRSLREQLLKEQKCVCCYCCKRINLKSLSGTSRFRSKSLYENALTLRLTGIPLQSPPKPQ